MPVKTTRTGFTLVELLVVISIIGVLAAILLPAINAARGAARQTECVNNVRNLTTAVQSYEASKNRMPPYATTVGEVNPLVAGFVYSILPMIEQSVIRDEIDVRVGDSNRAMDGNRIALQGNPYIKILNCPSNPSEGSAASSGYIGNGGHHDFVVGLDPDIRSNGALSYSVAGLGQKPFKVSMDHISSNDGTSLTAIISENVRWTNSQGLADWRPVAITNQDQYRQFVQYPHTFWWDSSLDVPSNVSTGSPPMYPPSGEFPSTYFNDNQQLQVAAQDDAQRCRDSSPSSSHQGGFVIGFADSHVVFINDKIDYRVYARLLTSDGRNASNGLSAPQPLNYQHAALGADELE